jgi:hypothetical protein
LFIEAQLRETAWLADAKDAISLKTSFGSLDNGAIYPAEITLSAPSQSLEVKITNAGCKKF